MKKSYFVVIIVFVSLLFMTWWVAAGIDAVLIFIDFPSAVVVLLFTLILLLANYSLDDIRKFFALGFRKEKIDPGRTFQ